MNVQYHFEEFPLHEGPGERKGLIHKLDCIQNENLLLPDGHSILQKLEELAYAVNRQSGQMTQSDPAHVEQK